MQRGWKHAEVQENRSFVRWFTDSFKNKENFLCFRILIQNPRCMENKL